MIRHLKESERQEAYEKARSWTAGKEPQLKDSKRVSKYDPRIVRVVLALCFVILGAAFTPSALRLYQAGREEFCRTSKYAPDCDKVGIATILLAETGSIVFILALSVVETSTRLRIRNVHVDVVSVLLWGSAATSVLVAIVGNAYIGKPWERRQLFDYLIVFVPPLLVLTVGYILKDLLLQSIKGRVIDNQTYNDRIEARNQLLEDPEKSEKWLRFYSKALKEAIQRANARQREELEDLSRGDWEQLIIYEIRESNWSVDASKVEEPKPQSNGNGFSWRIDDLMAEGYIWQNEGGLWAAVVPGTDDVIGGEFRSPNYAKMAILTKVRQNGHSA